VAGHDTVFLSVGVYKIDDNAGAQDPASPFGKIMEINVKTGKANIRSRGHRNPQGLMVTEAGQVYSTEHGPAGGDELNIITEGSNYGWPVVSLGVDYGAYNWGDEHPAGRHAGYQLPLFAWVPSIAVSNLIQVRGFNDRWDGDLLVASLKAQSLFRLRLDNGRVLYSEPIWLGQRIRDIAQLVNGTIVVWTDSAELLFISVDKEKLDANERFPSTIGDTVVANCMFCHHFGPTNAFDTAPSLTVVLNRKIASDSFRYSAALRSREGSWTEETLRTFLTNPEKFASGTSMAPPNLTSDGIDEVIRVLKQESDHRN
jgi:aldose sugar dehydrogenase